MVWLSNNEQLGRSPDSHLCRYPRYAEIAKGLFVMRGGKLIRLLIPRAHDKLYKGSASYS